MRSLVIFIILALLAAPAKPEPDIAFNITRPQVPLCTNPDSLVELATALLGPDSASSQAKAVAAAAHAVLYGTPLLAVANTFIHSEASSSSSDDVYNLTLLLSKKINVFQHEQQLSTPGASAIVTPNVDTLYSMAWLDLSAGPLVLQVPDTAGRYYLLQMLDMYTNLVSLIGSSTTGTKQGKFLIVPPGFKDTNIPAAFKACANGVNPGAPSANASSKLSCVVQAPTTAVSIIGRIMVRDPQDDLAIVLKLQQALLLKPLRTCPSSSSGSNSACAKPAKLARAASKATKLLDTFKSATGALKANTALLYFRGIASMMTAYQPPARDATYFKDWYEPYVGLDMAGRFKPTTGSTTAYVQGLQLALSCVEASIQNIDVVAVIKLGMVIVETVASRPPGALLGFSGWSPSGATIMGQPLLNGDFEQVFLTRAVIATAYYGALPQQEALYYVANTDNAGKVLSFGNSGGGSSSVKAYTVTFDGEPPAQAFWSLTLYDFNTKQLVANPINRYAIGGLTKGLNWVPGSKPGTKTLTVTITPSDQPPKEGTANWLPGAVNGRFYLILRVYVPESWAANRPGGYMPPPVLPSSS